MCTAICRVILVIGCFQILGSKTFSSQTKGSSAAASPASRLISAENFGKLGTSDDTAVLQKAIDQSAAKGVTLRVPASRKPYRVGPLTIPSNAQIKLESGVVIEARPGFTDLQKIINIVDVKRVGIVGYGATIRMDRNEYKVGEYRHCVCVSGGTDIELKGFTCEGAAGDGFYIGGGDSKRYTENIKLEDVRTEGSRRQGLTVISARNLRVVRCHFNHSRGVVPQSGIDLEPERPEDHIEGIHIEDSFTEGNAGEGVRIALSKLNDKSASVSIVISRHHDRSAGDNGLLGTNETRGVHDVRGTVIIDHFSSEYANLYGMIFSFWNSTGPHVSVTDLDVVNANQSHSTDDNSAVAIMRGGGGSGTIGNIAFRHASIRDTAKQPRLDHYFSFVDYSHVGIEKVEFSAPSVLSGAKYKSPLGIFQGRGVDTITSTDAVKITKMWHAAQGVAHGATTASVSGK